MASAKSKLSCIKLPLRDVPSQLWPIVATDHMTSSANKKWRKRSRAGLRNICESERLIVVVIIAILTASISVFIDVVDASVYLEYDPSGGGNHPPGKKAHVKEIKYESQPAFFGKRFEENVRYKARLQFLPHDEYLCNGVTDPDYNHFDDDAWYVPKLQQQDEPITFSNFFYGPRRSTIANLSSLRSERGGDRKLKVISMEEAVAKQIVEDELLHQSLKQRQQRQRPTTYDAIDHFQQRQHTTSMNNSHVASERNKLRPASTSSPPFWERKDRHKDSESSEERPVHFAEQQQSPWWTDDAADPRHDADDYLTADDHDFVLRYRHNLNNNINDDSDGEDGDYMKQDAEPVDDETMILNTSFMSRPHKDRNIDTSPDSILGVTSLVEEGYVFNKRKHRHNRNHYFDYDYMINKRKHRHRSHDYNHSADDEKTRDDVDNDSLLPNGGIVVPPDGSPVVLLAKRGMCNFETKAKAALALMAPMESNVVHYVVVYDNAPHKRLSPMSAASGRFEGEDQIGLLFVSLDSGNDMRTKLDAQSPEITKEGGMVVYMDSIAPWMPSNPFYNNIDGWIVVILTAVMTVMMLCGCLIMCCQTGLIRREGNVLIFGQPFAMTNQQESNSRNTSRLLTELEVLSLEEISYTPDPDDAVAVGGMKENETGGDNTMLSPLLLSDDRKMPAEVRNTTNDDEKMPSALHNNEGVVHDNVNNSGTLHGDDCDADIINSSCCNVPMCSVCLEEYEVGEPLRKLPCNHTFHTDCIVPWLTERSPLCPLCKCDIYQEKFAAFDQENEGDEDTERVAPRPDTDPGAEDSTVSSSDDNLETLAGRERWSLFSMPNILRRSRSSSRWRRRRQRPEAPVLDDGSDDESATADTEEALLEARAIDMLPNDEDDIEGSIDSNNGEDYPTEANDNGMALASTEAYHLQVAPSFETAFEGLDAETDGDDVFYAAASRYATGAGRRRQMPQDNSNETRSSDGHPGAARSTTATLPLLLDEEEEEDGSSAVVASSANGQSKKKSWFSSFFFGSSSSGSDFDNHRPISGGEDQSNTDPDDSADNRLDRLSSPLLSNQ